MTKERAAKIILDMINGAESTFGHSLSTTEINALKKGYCALNPEPSTNADRIRAMTDEELAEFLFSFDECDTTIGSGYSTTYYSQHFCTAPCGGDDTSECLHCITEWLKQEVEE